MKIIDGENWVFFDVDGTLIKETSVNPFTDIDLGFIQTREGGTYSKNYNGENYIAFFNRYISQVEIMVVENQHVRLLKHMAGRGRQIVVWSANGVDYATEVVKALGIISHVDYCMSKPLSCVDDLEPNQFMKRIFLKRGER